MLSVDDHDLLFGLLALRLGMMPRDALRAAAASGERPLAAALLRSGALTPANRDLLDTLVRNHQERHGGQMSACLAALEAPDGELDYLRIALSASSEQSNGATLDTLSRSAPAPDGNGTLNTLSRSAPAPDGTLDTVSRRGGPAPLVEPPRPPAEAGPRYRILRSLARGGLGEVFVASETELEREVALKEIQARHAGHAESRARFLIEARITGRLEHPGIVPVYGLGFHPDGRPFYAMRLIRGDSLEKAIARFHAGLGRDAGADALGLRQLLGRFIDMCDAMAYAHSRGIIHRDLKPANVMLGDFGETLVVDCLARSIHGPEEAAPSGGQPRLSGSVAGVTQMGDVVGTPSFMPPEQARGALDEMGPASDVYSLGATLYTLLAGRAPFEGRDTAEVLARVTKGEFPPPRQVRPAVPPALESVCIQAMALRPANRYATARALASEVEHWLADEPVAAYREPMLARLRRWGRRHRTLVMAGAALLATVLVALAVTTVLVSGALRKEEQARRDRSLAMVNALLDATPQAVPSILDGLDAVQDDVTPALRELWESDDPARPRRRMRAGLALLRVEPDAVQGPLFQWMLEVDDPAEMLLIRDALRPFEARLKEGLWRAAENAKEPETARFRALVALSAFDAASPRWAAAAPFAVEQFLSANPLHLGLWSEALRPVLPALRPPLTAVFRGQALADKRLIAATVLADDAHGQPALLADLTADADPQQFALLLPLLREQRAPVRRLLRAELSRAPAEGVSETERDASARRQAGAAVALLHLGEEDAVWPLLRLRPDPSLRTFLLHKLAPHGVDVGLLARRLAVEDDPSARRAMLVALGAYKLSEVTPEDRQPIVERLLRGYRDDPDPGIHGATDWLLRHAREGSTARPFDWHGVAALDQIAGERAGRPPEGRRWIVDRHGHTLVLVHGPVEFDMGSPSGEPERLANEALHRRRIGRDFAIASKLVTLRQFELFLQAHPTANHAYSKRFSTDPEGPFAGLTWFEAAQYCRWLSEREGVTEDQMCFPPVEVIEKSKDGKTPLVLPADYLQRTGYRLPTEAEWEYACRAGTTTSRFCGSAEDVLLLYAWSMANANDQTWPVGQKRPNELGLFDMHGNTWQWLQDAIAPYPTPSPPGATIDDREDPEPITDKRYRVLRGGAFNVRASSIRSAYRGDYLPSGRARSISFRVARTWK